MFQEIEEILGLESTRCQMDIRDEDGSKSLGSFHPKSSIGIGLDHTVKSL